MSLAVYQKQVDDWVQTYKKPYWSPLSQFARMTEEVGEVGRILNHMYGDKIKKPSEAPDDLAEELADVLFTVLAMANSEQINLDAAFAAIMHKAQTRDKDRFEHK